MNARQDTFRPPPSQLMIFLYRAGLGLVIGRLILLLTTTGRKSGLPRITPLQYEQVDDSIYVASARGARADWFRNILANRCVRVRIGLRQFDALAEPVTDPCRIADFLELRLHRHPRMVAAILHSEGLPAFPSRLDLEAYAKRLAMVILRPQPA